MRPPTDARIRFRFPCIIPGASCTFPDILFVSFESSLRARSACMAAAPPVLPMMHGVVAASKEYREAQDRTTYLTMSPD